jgi:uncharacterized membrane protein
VKPSSISEAAGMQIDEWMEHVVRGFEVAGVLILAIGSVWTLASAVPVLLKGDAFAAYTQTRQRVGRSVLLGLEILIIADIVQTITIDSTLESAATLGVIVLVRTFLSFSLEIELEGIVPWRRWTKERLDGESKSP